VKFTINNPIYADVRPMLQTQFASMLPSEIELADAFAARRPVDLARSIAGNSAQIIQGVQARIGINTGIPGNLVDGFTKVLSAVSLANTSSQAKLLAGVDAAASVLNDALAAAGMVPIVGWAVSLALGLAQLGQALADKGHHLPPMLSYHRDYDEGQARDAMAIVGSTSAVVDVDWTPLFLPRYTGHWDVYPQEQGDPYFKGWSFHPVDAANGMGCIPPGLFGSATIDANDTGTGLQLFGKRKSMTAWYRDHVYDTFQFLPSLAAIGNAAWYAAGSNATAVVYNMDYDRIAAAWQKWFSDAIALASFAEKVGSEVPKQQRWLHPITATPFLHGRLLNDALAHVNRINGRSVVAEIAPQPGTTSRKTPANDTAASWANLWCTSYNERARSLCKTAICAYASQRQTWFQASPEHRAWLDEGRRDLLEHPAVKAVDPDDVPDRNLREEIRRRGGGTIDPAKVRGWPSVGIGVSPPTRVPPPPALVGAGIDGAPSGAIAFGIAAALGLLGWWAWKTR
jgi:hypothetical protein